MAHQLDPSVISTLLDVSFTFVQMELSLCNARIPYNELNLATKLKLHEFQMQVIEEMCRKKDNLNDTRDDADNSPLSPRPRGEPVCHCKEASISICLTSCLLQERKHDLSESASFVPKRAFATTLGFIVLNAQLYYAKRPASTSIIVDKRCNFLLLFQ